MNLPCSSFAPRTPLILLAAGARSLIQGGCIAFTPECGGYGAGRYATSHIDCFGCKNLFKRRSYGETSADLSTKAQEKRKIKVLLNLMSRRHPYSNNNSIVGDFFFGRRPLPFGGSPLEAYSRTSGESNHHRQSVSDTRVPPYQLSHEGTYNSPVGEQERLKDEQRELENKAVRKICATNAKEPTRHVKSCCTSTT